VQIEPLSANVGYVVAPRTAKSLQMACMLLKERGENLLQNGILHFVFR